MLIITLVDDTAYALEKKKESVLIYQVHGVGRGELLSCITVKETIDCR